MRTPALQVQSSDQLPMGSIVTFIWRQLQMIEDSFRFQKKNLKDSFLFIENGFPKSYYIVELNPLISALYLSDHDSIT